MAFDGLNLADALKSLGAFPRDPTARFSEGDFRVWLGAGITPDNTERLMSRLVLELRSRAPKEPKAAEALQKLGSIVGGHVVDFTAEPLSEKDVSAGADRLAKDYSRAMQEVEKLLIPAHVDVALDLLDIPRLYSKETTPSAVHRLLALLMAEGLLDEVVTTNWDDCVERAWAELCPSSGDISVIVLDGELLDVNEPRLVKIHGCAKRAFDDRARYGGAIAVTKQHIQNRCVSGSPQMANHVGASLLEKSCILAGMSAQDEDIQLEFLKGQLASLEPKPQLPGLLERPRLMFTAKCGLGDTQTDLLRSLYGDAAWAEADVAIKDNASLPLWADELFGCFYFSAVRAKIGRALELVRGTDLSDEQADFCEAALDEWATHVIGACVGEGGETPWDQLVGYARGLSAAYEIYSANTLSRCYRAVVGGPLGAEDAVSTSERGIHSYFLALAALAHAGTRAGCTLRAGEEVPATVSIERDGLNRPVFLVRSSRYGKARLEAEGLIDDSTALLVYTQGTQASRPVTLGPRMSLPGVDPIDNEELFLEPSLAQDCPIGALLDAVAERL